MKKTIINGFIIILLTVTSCTSSFLDTEPKTSTNTGNFYKTVNDAYRAVIGCYDGWRATVSDGVPFYLASEIMSDGCFGGVGNSDGFEYQVVDRFDPTVSPSHSNLYDKNWELYYAAIYRCNALIQYEEQIDWSVKPELRGVYMGECRALRALNYFEMVRLWGNVPLITSPSTDNLPQSTPDKVYELIVEDLKFAIQNIPADAYPKSNSLSNDGHITKYAAQAMLAKVYLFYTGYYGKELPNLQKSEALEGLEEIINSGEYELVEEFKNLWPASSSKPVIGQHKFITTYAGKGNKEVLLAQKFNSTEEPGSSKDGNQWMRMMGLRNLSWSPYGKGWGCCTVNKEIWNAFKSGDTRKQASIIDFVGEGIAASNSFMTYIKDQREYTGYSVKKYSPLAFYDGTFASKEDGSGDFQRSNHQDYFVMRYADVLLMAAELESPHAKKYLNQVRKRAYQYSEEDELLVSASFKEIEPTKANILNERKLEFAFEGIRYWDLLRQGVESAAATIAESGYAVLSGNVPSEVVIKAENIIKTKGLSQIPENQINLSDGVLKQNEGW